jgi:hypothetical protein
MSAKVRNVRIMAQAYRQAAEAAIQATGLFGPISAVSLCKLKNLITASFVAGTTAAISALRSAKCTHGPSRESERSTFRYPSKAEVFCSQRVFPVVTRQRHWRRGAFRSPPNLSARTKVLYLAPDSTKTKMRRVSIERLCSFRLDHDALASADRSSSTSSVPMRTASPFVNATSIPSPGATR